MSSADEPTAAPGPVRAIRLAAALGAAAVVTRGELAALELTEAREQAARWLLLALAGAAFLVAALVVGSFWFVSVFWESYRTHAIAVVAIAYAIAAGGLVWWLLNRVRSSPPLLHATLEELRQDVEALRGAGRPSS